MHRDGEREHRQGSCCQLAVLHSLSSRAQLQPEVSWWSKAGVGLAIHTPLTSLLRLFSQAIRSCGGVFEAGEQHRLALALRPLGSYTAVVGEAEVVKTAPAGLGAELGG